MVRLLIEDVTLLKAESITAHIRFKGGATRSLTLPVPLPAWATWQTDPQLVPGLIGYSISIPMGRSLPC